MSMPFAINLDATSKIHHDKHNIAAIFSAIVQGDIKKLSELRKSISLDVAFTFGKNVFLSYFATIEYLPYVDFLYCCTVNDSYLCAVY